MKTLFILMIIIAINVPLAAMADEHRVNVGIFTEHYESDSAEYNEDNEFVQYMYKADSDYVFTGGTFLNSHFERSHVAGAGQEWDDTIGVYLAGVHGYEDYLDTHWKGIIFVPILYIRTWRFTHTVMGTAYNISYTIEF